MRRPGSLGAAVASDPVRSVRWAAGLALLVALGGCGRGPAPPPPRPAAPAGQLHDALGRRASVDDVVAVARGVDVLFMGELHGNPAAHDLQLRLLERLVRDARTTGREVVLSLEMFETDVQLVLDEYLAGLIPESQFLAAARPWTRYGTDYRPLVELAAREGIRVVAANAPRRYVNRVSRLGTRGLDDLSPAALEHLPPLPFPEPSPAYRAEWDRRMAELAEAHGGGHGGAHGDPAGDRALMAQALWDAAMGWSIHRVLGGEEGGRSDRPPGTRPGPLVLHLTGSFHVENRTGTPEALRHYRPGVRYRVITTREAADPTDFHGALEGEDPGSLADFILLVPAAPPVSSPSG